MAETYTPLRLPPRPAWWAQAACRQRPDVNFFPELGESTARAKAVCSACEARDACLAFAEAEGLDHGVWGGLSPQQRRDMRKRRAAA